MTPGETTPLGGTGGHDHPSEPTWRLTDDARRHGQGRAERACAAGRLDHAEHGGRLSEGRRGGDASTGTRQGSVLVRYLARARQFHGIGEATAHRLWDTFGESLYRRLADNDPSALSPVLDAERSADLQRAWREHLAEGDVAVWLDENRFDHRLAAKIIRVWGTNGVARLRENPYVMLTFADWRRVDDAARRVGIPADDPRRLVGAVEALLYERLEGKHTAIARRDLEGTVGEMLLSGPGVARMAVDLAITDGAAATSPTGLLQAAGAAVMERYVETRFERLLVGVAQGGLFAGPLKPDDVQSTLIRFEEGVGYRLTEEQRAAVRLAHDSSLGLILGGAGVGKTTVLRAVHAVARQRAIPVFQMALSGRASQRLREATGEWASTIAGFLTAVGSGRVEVSADALVVVDEASMLDLGSCYRLLRAIPETCRLLLVGDPAQLAPIGFGLVLHVLTRSARIPQVELTMVHRQAEATGIPAVAAAIRRGVFEELPRFPGDARPGVSVAACAPDRILAVLEDVVASLGGHGEAQVISPLRQGSSGTEAINRRFHDLLSPGRPLLHGHEIAVGEPVVWTVNNWKRGLMNGSLGVVRLVEADGTAAVSFDDGEHVLAAGHEQAPLDLAYAITVHKAQGSAFRRVVVPVVRSRILDRTLVYTAITRATEQVVLVGDLEAVRSAVASLPRPDERVVGLDV